MAETEPAGDYVTAAAWTRPPGRDDHIDEVADQFERCAEPDAERFWTGAVAGWPTPARRVEQWGRRQAG